MLKRTRLKLNKGSVVKSMSKSLNSANSQALVELRNQLSLLRESIESIEGNTNV